jgi:hypothetical protein
VVNLVCWFAGFFIRFDLENQINQQTRLTS